MVSTVDNHAEDNHAEDKPNTEVKETKSEEKADKMADVEVLTLDSSGTEPKYEQPVERVNINDSDSNSDILVIDMNEDDILDKTDTKPKEILPEKPEKPGKRKRNSTSTEDKPAKNSRRTSLNSVKKFEQVENELEAMFGELKSDKEDEIQELKIEKIKNENSKPAGKSAQKESKESKTTKESKVTVKEEKPEKKAKAPAKKPRRKSTEVKAKNEKNGCKSDKNGDKSSRDLKDSILSEQEKLLEKFKGPFVKIDGKIDDIRWQNIVNNSTDAIKPSEETKSLDLDQVARVGGFGYNLTTLSSKYDPRNVDESWICVFCRKPSHYKGLGDLYGPYFIPSIQWKSLNLPSPQKSQSSKSDLASSFILGGSDQAGAKAKKRQQKRKSGQLISPPYDASGSPGSGSGSQSKGGEVWFHEDCVCWMPQIRLIGCQILGLAEAIRVSQKSVCSKCNFKGSTLACKQMRCRETAHFPCGQDLDWNIDEEDFLSTCQLHNNSN